jgi:hypothetical protein
MQSLTEHARQIFEVAKAADGEAQDFALLIRPDGGLHFVMETPFSIEAATSYVGAQAAFRVTRSKDGVRVEGQSLGETCLLEARNAQRELLPDRPLYWMSSPLLTAGETS